GKDPVGQYGKGKHRGFAGEAFHAKRGNSEYFHDVRGACRVSFVKGSVGQKVAGGTCKPKIKHFVKSIDNQQQDAGKDVAVPAVAVPMPYKQKSQDTGKQVQALGKKCGTKHKFSAKGQRIDQRYGR